MGANVRHIRAVIADKIVEIIRDNIPGPNMISDHAFVVERVRRPSHIIEDVPACTILTGSDVYSPEATAGINRKMEAVTEYILSVIDNAESEDADELLSSHLHDIVRALGQDHTLGETCEDSWFVESTVFLDEISDPLAEMIIRFRARYHYFDNDPAVRR